MKYFSNLWIKALLKAHNFLYYKISISAVKLNNGMHPKHRIMKYHQYFIDNIEENSKILDIGCGIGALANSIAKKAEIVIACDINRNSIEMAKSTFKNDNVKFIYADATSYEFNENFDCIILSNVLEHIKDRIIFLKKIKHLAKYMLIRVPMIDRSWLPLYKKELGVKYRLDSSHYIEYTFVTFQKEIENAGLQISSFSMQFGEIWAKVKSNI